MKNIYNPTDSLIYMVYNGTRYEIPANSEIEVSDDVADHWKIKVHEFVQIKPIKKAENVVPVESKKSTK